MMGGGIAETYFCLRSPDGIGEGSAARHDDSAASAVCQGVDPTNEMSGAGKAAAKLDYDDVIVAHLVGRLAFARHRGE
jgi:hypothetical protein